MSNLNDIGNLIHLPIDEIQPTEGTNVSEFLITATAQALNKLGGRNWVPIIVKKIGDEQYEIIGNSFIYAVAEKAGLRKIWCIVADSSKETEELTKILSNETTPKINLSIATREEIQAALQFLIEKPGTDFSGVKLLIATNRLDEDPSRPYWKTLEPIAALKCGITKGKKLNALKEVFCLQPQSQPEVVTDIDVEDTKETVSTLSNLTVKNLKELAKQRGISGYNTKKKLELIKLLS